MHTSKFTILIALLTTALLICGCAQPAASPDIVEEAAKEIVVPTEIPTQEPQPTATETRIESGFFTYIGNVWATVYEDEMTFPVFLPEEMMGGDMENFQLVQYGFFSDYDTANLVLTIRAKVEPGELYRTLEFQLEEGQKISCLPETLSDTPISDVRFMVSNGKVKFPNGMSQAAFSDILPALTDSSYMVVELAEMVQAETPNIITMHASICP